MSGSQDVRLPLAPIRTFSLTHPLLLPTHPRLLAPPVSHHLLPKFTLTPPPDKTEEVRRLGLGRLLDDMSRKMQRKVQSSSKKEGEKDPLKILVHSTHDTALAGLLSTLDVYDDK